MMSEAIETCCRSMPSAYMKTNVRASVSGIARAITSADRHSQNPINATMTTSTMAS